MAVGVINSISQRPMIDELYSDPSIEDIKYAIKQISSEKAPGLDDIPPEVFKYGGIKLTKTLHELFVCIWIDGTVPQQFKDESISHSF